MNGIDISKYKVNATASAVKQKQASRFDFLYKEFTWFGSKIGNRKREAFYLELSILLAAGVDLNTALQLFVEEQSKPSDRQLFDGIRKAVVEGSNLSEALKHTRQFSAYEFLVFR
jgi:type IV pilus assembly protein PilC